MRYLILLTLLAPLTALAQPLETKETKAPPAQDGASAEMGGGRVDPRELLEQVMMARLSKELALDEQQTVLMVRRFMEHRENVRSMRQQRGELLRELKQAVRAAQDEMEVGQKLQALIAHDDRMKNAPRELYDGLSQGLTEWQRGRLYLFLSEFETDMRRMVQRARERTEGREVERAGRPGFRREQTEDKAQEKGQAPAVEQPNPKAVAAAQ